MSTVNFYHVIMLKQALINALIVFVTWAITMTVLAFVFPQ